MKPERVGPYRIDDVLGSGGMGEVYAAYDERLDRRVAIKAVLPGRELSGERRERLLLEARAAAALSHAAVAQVHDIVTEGDRSYIVMEFVEGETLAEVVARGHLDLRVALRLGQQVAEGLHAAHQRGIVHRDLKAENIMVTPSGQAKILDFGLAKRLDPSGAQAGLTADGVVMGTCHAMSPEQAEGRPVDHRSDLFALGTLLYRMVTGEHPFAVDSPMATMRRIVAHEPPSPHELRPSVPPPVSRLILRLLAKEPGSRPDSADEVARVLRAQCERSAGEATVQTRSLALARRARWLRGRRAAVAAGLALAVAAVGALVGWRHLSQRPPLVVAVTKPEAAGHPGDEDVALAAAAVREALLSTVVGLEGLVALSPETVDAVSGTPAEVARALAADEVLAATVDATGAPCRVVLRRLAGADGRLLWTSGVFEAPASQLRLMADAVTAQVRRGYPNRRPREGAIVSEASPEDYAEYLRLDQLLQDPRSDASVPDVLDRLSTLRESSPRLLEAYLTEVTHLRYLYQTTRRPELLRRARRVAEAAREVAPADPRPVHAEIEVALASNDSAAAARALDRLVALNPSDPSVTIVRARIARQRGELVQALELYRTLAEDRLSWSVASQVADLELQLGRVDEAREHLEQGLRVAPDSRFLLARLAQLELAHGDLGRAEGLFAALVARFESPAYLTNLGTARLLLGRYAEAATAYRDALALAPDHPLILLNLADAMSLEGLEVEAAATYRQALSLVPGDSLDVEDLATRALCLAHLGHRVEAAAAATEALRASGDDPQTLYDAALVYALVGDHSSALASAKKALSAGFRPVWFNLPWFAPLWDDPSLRELLPGVSREAASTPSGGSGR